jgi:hypothetical protein
LLETVELRFGVSFVRERWSQKGLVTRWEKTTANKTKKKLLVM